MKAKIPLGQARSLAERIAAQFAPACQSIAIAGSVRRGRRACGDIEIVAIPRYIEGVYQPSLLGDTEPAMVSELDRLLDKLVEQKPHFERAGKDGPLFKNFKLYAPALQEEVGIDLFLTTPEQWGYILALRTGPGDFNRAWVTQRGKGGLLPDEYRFEGGWLIGSDGKQIATPDEKEFFKTIGLPWIDPDRRDEWRRVV